MLLGSVASVPTSLSWFQSKLATFSMLPALRLLFILSRSTASVLLRVTAQVAWFDHVRRRGFGPHESSFILRSLFDQICALECGFGRI